MIDWTSILIAVLTGGTIYSGWEAYKYRRENKALKKSEVETAKAQTKSAEAGALEGASDVMGKMMDNVKKQQITFNEIIEGKDNTIKQQSELINEYKKSLEDAHKKLKEFEYIMSENRRKIEGIQKEYNDVKAELEQVKKTLKTEIAKGEKCAVLNCKLRQPPLVTDIA